MPFSLTRPLLFCLFVGVLFHLHHSSAARRVQAGEEQATAARETPAAHRPPPQSGGFAFATDQEEEALPVSAIEPDISEEPAEQALHLEAADGGTPTLASPAVDAEPDITPLDTTPVDVRTIEDMAAEPQAVRELKLPPAEPELPKIPVEPATFNGVQPGKSGALDVEKAFGKPTKSLTQEKKVTLTYHLKPFKRVQVTIQSGTVQSIVIHLEKPLGHDALTKQLKLDDVQSVKVVDNSGQPMGYAFPERGVLFSFAPNTRQVSEILLESITPEPFFLRAEYNLAINDRQSLADLTTGLSLDPGNANARWLRVKILMGFGRHKEALQEIDESLARDPVNAQFLVARVAVLSELGHHAEAMAAVRQVLASAEVPAVVKARASTQLGDLLTWGSQPDYKESMDHYLAAIKLAEPVAKGPSRGARRIAKEILVDANLGVAYDIAFGFWQKKEHAVPKWLQRAKLHADDLIARDGAPPELHLHVCRQAISMYAGLNAASDVGPWTDDALQTGRKLINDAQDAGRKRRLQWELGSTLAEAVHVEHERAHHDKALELGRIAASYLQEGGKYRQRSSVDAQRVGRLYFEVGYIQAVQKNDHSTAVVWYRIAAPLLEFAAPLTSAADGKRGESFVSMGVSFWETGERDEAVRLTQLGADLISKSVADESLDPASLAIPYSNLASMHQEMGQADKAKEFAEMAEANSNTKVR